MLTCPTRWRPFPRWWKHYPPRTRRSCSVPATSQAALSPENGRGTARLCPLWANLYVNTILRLHVKDATAGVKAWHADTLRRIDVPSIRSNGYAFQVEMNYRTAKHGMRIAEIPIRFEERADGVSKMSLGVQIESALMPWKLLLGEKLGWFSHLAGSTARTTPRFTPARRPLTVVKILN